MPPVEVVVAEILRSVLEEMIWAWIQNVVVVDYVPPYSPKVIEEILDRTNKECVGPLKDAGIIHTYQISLNHTSGGLALSVDVTQLGAAFDDAVHNPPDSVRPDHG